MSEASSGSAAIAGNPAGQQAAGDQPGGAPAASTPPAAGNWYDGFQDAELKGYVQNKGWKDPSELAVGYKNLEKLLGSEKLPMPKGADDAEGWSRVYDALGRPKEAGEYKLPIPQGDNGEFAKAAAAWMHEAGLNQRQAEMLASKWNEHMGGLMGAEQQQSFQRVEADMAALRGEWGQAWDENINLGQRAAKTFGLDAAKLEALESAWGTKDMLQFMAKIGRGLTEHNFEGGQNINSFGMTPEAARERINALRNDSGWASKYMNGDVDAQNEMKRLMSIAFPE